MRVLPNLSFKVASQVRGTSVCSTSRFDAILRIDAMDVNRS